MFISLNTQIYHNLYYGKSPIYKKLNFKCYFQRLLNIICIKNCFKYSGYNNLNLNATAKKKKAQP